MKKKSHLIIGSNSFLGVAIAKALQKKNVVVLGVYHNNKNNLNSEIDHIPISSWNVLNDDFDVVYMVSAYVPKYDDTENIDDKLIEVNVNLVKTICDTFKSAKIVYCSSVSVYGNSTEIVSENSTVNPVSAYAKSKFEGEKIVRQQNRYAIVRISSMYGPQMNLSTFLPLIIQNALHAKSITLYGDGSRLQNYIHVDDVANYLVTASDYSENETFLATYSESFSNKAIADCIAGTLKDISIEFKGVDDSNSYLYNNEMTINNLRINCSIDLKKGLNQLIAWMKKEL